MSVPGTVSPATGRLPWPDLLIPAHSGQARLRPLVSPGAGDCGARGDHGRRPARPPRANENVTVAVRPFDEDLTRNVRTRLLVLMGTVTLVLLIAAGNGGNLLLARAATRGREIALRQALVQAAGGSSASC